MRAPMQRRVSQGLSPRLAFLVRGWRAGSEPEASVATGLPPGVAHASSDPLQAPDELGLHRIRSGQREVRRSKVFAGTKAEPENIMAIRAVETCRWGTPTLFLPWPLWCEASQHEWSCTRGVVPTILADPAICRTCPYWLPAERQVSHPPQRRSGCRHQHALVLRDPDEGETSDRYTREASGIGR